jgi:hypothetical protein
MSIEGQRKMCHVQITDETKNVCCMDLPANVDDAVVATLHRHIRNLITERDHYLEVICSSSNYCVYFNRYLILLVSSDICMMYAGSA